MCWVFTSDASPLSKEEAIKAFEGPARRPAYGFQDDPRRVRATAAATAARVTRNTVMNQPSPSATIAASAMTSRALTSRRALPPSIAR